MAEEKTMTPLERQFHDEMISGSIMLKKEGYNPTYFLQMVADCGGVEAVRRLLRSKDSQSGLTSLWEIKRLDMSCEQAILQPKYRSLFTEAERQMAIKRLEAIGYKPKLY